MENLNEIKVNTSSVIFNDIEEVENKMSTEDIENSTTNSIETLEDNSMEDIKKSTCMTKFKKYWDNFLNIKWNAMINFITMFIFVGCYATSFLTVPDDNGKTNTSIIIVITIIFTMIFTRQFGYVIDIYRNRRNEDLQWNINQAEWNAFLLLFITFGSILSICFFMIRSQGLEVYNDFISEFDTTQNVVFSFDIILYFILIGFVSYHLVYHMKNIRNVHEKYLKKSPINLSSIDIRQKG